MTDWTGHQMWTEAQFKQLVHAINPSRVRVRERQSYVAQHDVRAHLTRVFGFGMWEKSVQELTMVSQERATGESKGKPKTGWDVVYRCVLRLRVYSPNDPSRATFWETEDVAIGQGSNQPTLDAAHDLAAKTAVSYALKRCAIDLGDQFGLGLYNGGQTAAFVGGSHIRPPDPEQGEVTVDTATGVIEGVEIVSDGHDDEGSQEVPEYDNPGTADTSKLTRHRPEAPEVPCKGSCASSYPPDRLRDGLCRPCWYAARGETPPNLQGPPEPAPEPSPAPPASPAFVVAGAAVKVESPTSLGVRWNKVPAAVDVVVYPTVLTPGEGIEITVPAGQNTALLEGLEPGTAYTVQFSSGTGPAAEVAVELPVVDQPKSTWPKVAKVKP